jgi:hypothetical protein
MRALYVHACPLEPIVIWVKIWVKSGRPFRIGLQRSNGQTGEHRFDDLGYDLIHVQAWSPKTYHNDGVFS